MPGASAAHPLSQWPFYTSPWRISCSARPGLKRLSSFSEHTSPGSWMLSSLCSTYSTRQGILPQLNIWQIFTPYNLRIFKWDCTVWGLFSDFLKMFLPFTLHVCVCEKANNLFSQMYLERLLMPHGVVEAPTVSHFHEQPPSAPPSPHQAALSTNFTHFSS